MLLDHKRLVITGVLTDDSIAFHCARVAQEEGADVVLTGFGRGLRITERSAQRVVDGVRHLVHLGGAVPDGARQEPEVLDGALAIPGLHVRFPEAVPPLG